MRFELHEAAPPQGTPSHLAHFIDYMPHPMTVDAVELLSSPGGVRACSIASFTLGAERPTIGAVRVSHLGTQTRTYLVLSVPMTVSVGSLVSLLADGAVSAVLVGRELGESLKRRRSCPHCGGSLV